MHIIVDDLETSISQVITPTRFLQLGAVRIYLYKNGTIPSGSLKLSIKRDSTVIWTSTKLISDMFDSTDYFHGFYTWELSENIKLYPEEYEIIIEGVLGYSTGIGWVKEHENHTNNFTEEINNRIDYPHSIQIWERESLDMIRILNISDGFTSASAPTVTDFELDIDGIMYWRQNVGVDTSGDFRQRVNSGVLEIQKYSGSAWVTVETFELGA